MYQQNKLKKKLNKNKIIAGIVIISMEKIENINDMINIKIFYTMDLKKLIKNLVKIYNFIQILAYRDYTKRHLGWTEVIQQSKLIGSMLELEKKIEKYINLKDLYVKMREFHKKEELKGRIFLFGYVKKYGFNLQHPLIYTKNIIKNEKIKIKKYPKPRKGRNQNNNNEINIKNENKITLFFK